VARAPVAGPAVRISIARAMGADRIRAAGHPARSDTFAPDGHLHVGGRGFAHERRGAVD
jgi:hypothetical protein